MLGTRRLLMSVALRDLRCLDAHAHLGNLIFDRRPEDAIVHYEIGGIRRAQHDGIAEDPRMN